MEGWYITKPCVECGGKEFYYPKTKGFGLREFVPLLIDGNYTSSEVRARTCKNCGVVDHTINYKDKSLVIEREQIIKYLKCNDVADDDINKAIKLMKFKNGKGRTERKFVNGKFKIYYSYPKTFFAKYLQGKSLDVAIRRVCEAIGIEIKI